MSELGVNLSILQILGSPFLLLRSNKIKRENKASTIFLSNGKNTKLGDSRIADYFGITVEQLAEIQSYGTSLQEYAIENGFSVSELKQVVEEEIVFHWEKAYRFGVISEKLYQELLERNLKDIVERRVSKISERAAININGNTYNVIPL